MSIFTDRRPLSQIGGMRGYLRQVTWSLRWRLEWHRRERHARAVGGPAHPAATSPRRPVDNELR